jgi:hypothetical protein
MEEQVLHIGEIINSFRAQIEDLQLRIMPRMPPKV